MTPIVLLILACLAAAGAVFLWRAARAQEAAQEQRSLTTPAGAVPAASADSTAPAAPPDATTADNADRFAAEWTGWGGAQAPAASPAPSPEAGPAQEDTPQQPIRTPEVGSETRSETRSEPDTELDAELDQETEPVLDPELKSAPKKKSSRPILPGSLRRERKAWANQHGFDFAKEDSYLADEWTRGAAAGGSRPRDIAHGTAFGHELFLLDLGGVNVMALRTGASSDVVVDFRRTGLPLAEEASEDLVAATEIAGFSVYTTEPGVVERMIDDRLITGLEYLPAAVTAVWMESEWVLAQTDKTARGNEWDEMLAPMAVLADVARVLPPRPGAGRVLRPEQAGPTRVVPPQPVAATGSTAVFNPAEELARPPVQRPEEPMVLPSRRAGAAHGAMEHRALGADEVDAIADGQERPQADESVARLPRDPGRGSSIFDEIEAELGPIGDIPEHPGNGRTWQTGLDDSHSSQTNSKHDDRDD